jgi:hypothetical protein
VGAEPGVGVCGYTYKANVTHLDLPAYVLPGASAWLGGSLAGIRHAVGVHFAGTYQAVGNPITDYEW